VSPAVYRRRRLAAGLVVVSVLALVLLGVRALLGGDAGPSVDAAATDPSGSTSAPGAAVSTPASTPVTPPSTAAPTVPPTSIAAHGADWVPSAADPATLYIAGDSDAGTFGPFLETLMDQTGMVRTVLDYKVSSGLARPDFYDWPARFAEQLPLVNPDVVVVTFGGNDGQGLSLADGSFVVGQPTGEPGGDAEWRAEYGKRVGAVMDELAAENRTLIWVGIPNDDNPEVTARMQVQDEVVKAEAAKREGVVMIDTWSRFSGRDGGWAEYVIDPRDGIGKDVRAGDGFHLNTTGAEILALDIAEAIRADLRTRGAEL
jgi:hypothetical protein